MESSILKQSPPKIIIVAHLCKYVFIGGQILKPAFEKGRDPTGPAQPDNHTYYIYVNSPNPNTHPLSLALQHLSPSLTSPAPHPLSITQRRHVHLSLSSAGMDLVAAQRCDGTSRGVSWLRWRFYLPVVFAS